MPSNGQIGALFAEYAALLEILDVNPFKVKAFVNVARALEELPDDIATLACTPGALEKVQGIGPSSAAKIREICSTGRMADLEELRAKVPVGLIGLLGISGLGAKTLRVLWEKGGVVDRDSLKAKLETGELTSIKGLGEKSLQKIREAITLNEKSAGRIRLGEALPLAERVVEIMRGVRGVRRVAFAGSLRRGRDTIGDIDILCATDDVEAAHAAFRALPGVATVLVSGGTKTSVVTGLGFQIDLRVLPEASFGAALMYFTGSKEHNVKLRERAIAMGFRLNEYGLFAHADGADEAAPQHRGIAPVVSLTEEEIYAKLGLPYVPPELREDRGELTRPIPALLELADLRAELHAHTTASDGAMAIDGLADAAKAKGFHTIAVTDHSQSSFQANGLKPERLLEHIAEIHAVAARRKDMRILAGSEVDIHPDGRLDYDDELLAQLDIVVASPHAALRQDPDAATKRLVRAIENPHVRIIGHPTGRIINGRAGIEPDMKDVIAAARANDVALEINANPMRLDLRDSHVKAAVDAGVLIAINCDTHSIDDLEHARYGVLTARRGWLTAEQCINCWDREKLRKWLRRAK